MALLHYNPGEVLHVEKQISIGMRHDPSPRKAKVTPFGEANNDNKENVSSNPRSILKKLPTEQLNTPKKSALVKFAPDIQLSKPDIKEMEVKRRAVAALKTLILIWAKQSAKAARGRPNYKNRLISNFQPGLTPRYIQYLINAFPKAVNIGARDLEGLEVAGQTFVTNFRELRNRIVIVDKDSFKTATAEIEKNQDPVLIIIQIEDLMRPEENLAALLEQHIRGSNSLLVLSNPICGLQQRVIEEIYDVKVRHVWFPRIDTETKLRRNPDYKFSRHDISNCFGLPAVLEQGLSSQESNKAMREILQLWKKPEFKPYMGYFYTLFSLAHSKTQVYESTMLSAEISVFDAATILGFDIIRATDNRKNSDGTAKMPDLQMTPPRTKRSKNMPLLNAATPFSIFTNDTVLTQFLDDKAGFDAFKLIRANSLKWFEAERAVARAITDGSRNKKTFCKQWPFFEHSRLKSCKDTLLLQPQVIPKVCGKGADIDKDTLNAWADGNREQPPQSTMNRRGWASLLEKIQKQAVIIPSELAKSPDVMFKMSTNEILCFQVKTGVQDLDVQKLMKEVAKSPFLDLNATETEVIRMPECPETPIVFVYVAAVHAKIKTELTKTEDQFIKQEFEFIQVESGSSIMPLPKDVEVIILLRAGLEALFGKDYNALLDPQCEIKALGAEEATRQELRKKTQRLPKTDEDIRSAARVFFDSIKHIKGAENVAIGEINKLFGDLKKKKTT